MAFNFLERKSRITSDTLKTFNETRESHHYIEYKDKSGLLKPDTIEWVKSYPKWWYNSSIKHFNYAAPLSPTTLEMPSGHKDKNAGGMELGWSKPAVWWRGKSSAATSPLFPVYKHIRERNQDRREIQFKLPNSSHFSFWARVKGSSHFYWESASHASAHAPPAKLKVCPFHLNLYYSSIFNIKGMGGSRGCTVAPTQIPNYELGWNNCCKYKQSTHAIELKEHSDIGQ